MTGSMYAAIAGLRTHMQNLNVIGNNVANVNTNGYKASRAVFKTSIYTSLNGGSNGTSTLGGINPSQIGYGANVSTVDIDMSTGNYAVTGKATDLMLDGDGFFMVGTKDLANNFNGSYTDVNALTAFKLTRVGNFNFGPDGYLVKEEGNCVYGFMCIGLANEADVKAGKASKLGDPIYSDQLVPIRYPRLRDAYFDENGEEITEGEAMEGTAPNQTLKAGCTKGKAIAYAQLGYSEKATTVPDPKVAKPDNGRLVDFGTYFNEDTKEYETQYPMAQFQNISVDQGTGQITAVSNDTGEVVHIGCIAVGLVRNPNGVTNLGSNYYKAGPGSGDLTVAIVGGAAKDMKIEQVNKSINAPAAGGTGGTATAPAEIDGLRTRTSETQVLSNGLEMSKTDLAQEIANMILTQRGYQANTRIITVTDSMLEELVNMKR